MCICIYVQGFPISKIHGGGQFFFNIWGGQWGGTILKKLNSKKTTTICLSTPYGTFTINRRVFILI